MTNGFRINKLCARGEDQPDREMEFGGSLNVVSGASNTGKSYLFNCIEYMLGREKPAESVPEDRGYDKLFLEIQTYYGKVMSLQRSLKRGGDYLIYDCSIADIGTSSKPEKVRWKYAKTRTDTIPAILMSICDLSGKAVQTNSRGTTRPLHFSDVRHLSMISEQAIIDDRTPIWPSGIPINRVVEEDVFNFILSGEDSSSVIEKPEVKVAKAGWSAKVELYEKMIADLEAELEETAKPIESNLDSIQIEIEDSTVAIEERSLEIQALLETRREKWGELRTARSRAGVIEQLRARFVLLTKHYQSDLERLKFVGESDFFLSQIGAGHCPVCGSLLDDHTADELSAANAADTNIQDASRREAEKLSDQLTDLQSTMAELEIEESQLNLRMIDLKNEIAANNESVAKNLEPEIALSRNRLQSLVDSRGSLLIAENKRDQLELLRSQLADLGDEPKKESTKSKLITQTVSISKARRQFCDAMEARLTAWKLPNVGTIEFDAKTDVVINGQARRTHGKGYRAIIHAAFTITLMTEFKNRHSHLVLLDSPLTSFKDKDDYELSDDVQNAFYEDLLNLADNEQVIIFENKDPPEEVQQRMVYHHFSGVPGDGRQGFYPPLQD